MVESRQFARELLGNCGSVEIESFQHNWDDIAFVFERRFYFKTQPI